MTTITLEGVEIDLERFATEVDVFFRYMRKNSLMIPTSQSIQDFIKETIEEQSNESGKVYSENGRNDSHPGVR